MMDSPAAPVSPRPQSKPRSPDDLPFLLGMVMPVGGLLIPGAPLCVSSPTSVSPSSSALTASSTNTKGTAYSRFGWNQHPGYNEHIYLYQKVRLQRVMSLVLLSKWNNSVLHIDIVSNCTTKCSIGWYIITEIVLSLIVH